MERGFNDDEGAYIQRICEKTYNYNSRKNRAVCYKLYTEFINNTWPPGMKQQYDSKYARIKDNIIL